MKRFFVLVLAAGFQKNDPGRFDFDGTGHYIAGGAHKAINSKREAQESHGETP